MHQYEIFRYVEGDRFKTINWETMETNKHDENCLFVRHDLVMQMIRIHNERIRRNEIFADVFRLGIDAILELYVVSNFFR